MKFKEKLVNLKAYYGKTTNDIINETGISIYEYEACESGVADPSNEFLLTIANYYKVNIGDLLNDDVDINDIINNSKLSESHDVHVDYDFSNNSNSTWEGNKSQQGYTNGAKTTYNNTNRNNGGFQNGNNINNNGPYSNGSNMNNHTSGPYNNGNNMNNNGSYNSPFHKNSYNNTNKNNADEGSTGIGFILGFFLGCIGIIIALVMGKSKTTNGCIIGFAASFIFNIIFIIIYIWFYDYYQEIIAGYMR